MNEKIFRKEYNFEELVTRGIESDELDYKAPMSWKLMSRTAKGKLVRHLTAFANTKGGFLVIGVAEDASGNPVLRTGLTKAEAGSFDPTPIGIFLNSHVEPPIDFTIARPVIHGKHFVIFIIRPFKTLPHVCSCGIEGELQTGVFYIRTQEASSRPAHRALEMLQLLQRAMRNEREQLGRMLRGILYESRAPIQPQEEGSRCTDLIEESYAYFSRRVRITGRPVLRIGIIPGEYREGRFSSGQLRQAVEAAWRMRLDSYFLRDGEEKAKETPASLRSLSLQNRKMWQLFNSGLFCYFFLIREEGGTGVISFADFVRFCAEAVDFFARLYGELGWSDELLTIYLSLENANQLNIRDEESGTNYTAETSNVTVEICRSCADLLSGKENHAERLVRRMGEYFHLPDQMLDGLTQPIGKFLEQR